MRFHLTEQAPGFIISSVFVGVIMNVMNCFYGQSPWDAKFFIKISWPLEAILFLFIPAVIPSPRNPSPTKSKKLMAYWGEAGFNQDRSEEQ